MGFETFGELLVVSLQNLWIGVIAFLPKLIIALVILVIGWLIGVLFEMIITKFIDSIKLDKLLSKTGLESILSKAGYQLRTGAFIGGLVKWFFVIAFLMASFDVLGLVQVNQFLIVVVNYIPNVIVAALILLVGAVVADVSAKVVSATVKATSFGFSETLGVITKWAIWIFTILIVLSQLGIASALIQTIFMGVVAMLALAGGLAFGLGGKEHASALLSKFTQSKK